MNALGQCANKIGNGSDGLWAWFAIAVETPA
jgi:hypothetical protein